MAEDLIILEEPPSVTSFIEFREDCGWGKISPDVAKGSLANRIFQYSAYIDGELVGFVGVVGDGYLYFYVQDLIVKPDCRGLGIGRSLMKRTIAKLDEIVPPGGSVHLMAATDKEEFYSSLGFVARPTTSMGAGMTWMSA